jgi:hypothetical protein
MLIIRKNQTNNLIATASMNRTLSNPYYLFSFQHIASKERVSFIPEVLTSNCRYDKFRFIEGYTNNFSNVPPIVNFPYLGQYYYSIYEQTSSTNTNPALSYNKVEAGRANVIVGNDNTLDCFFEPYVSNNEIFENIIYVSEQEELCISGDTTPECFSGLTGDCPTFLSTASNPKIYYNNNGVPGFLNSFQSCAPAAFALNSNTNKMFMVDGCSNYYEFDYVITSGGCFNQTLVNKWSIWDAPQYSATPNATYTMGIYDDNTIIIGANASFISQTGSTLYLYDLTTSGLTPWLETFDNSRAFTILYNTGNTQSILAKSIVSTDVSIYELWSGSTNPVLVSQITGDTLSGMELYLSGDTPVAVNVAGIQHILDFSAGTSTLVVNPITGLPEPYVRSIEGDLNYSDLSDIFQSAECYDFRICPSGITTQYLDVVLSDGTKFVLSVWNDSGFTSSTQAICNYDISGTATGSLGTVFTGVETINQGQHSHQFNLAPVFLPGETIVSFDVLSADLNDCICVDLILPSP